MSSEINLSETEKVAKKFVLHVMFQGLKSSEPCDVSITNDTFRLPDFYDDKKFKRGQKYFADNRAGIMLSNLYGLFSLICEPAGAKLLDQTDHSSTPLSAKKRYISTTLHMLSWYTDELKEGSNSWESLKRVRKMHLAASNAAKGRGYQAIPQCAMSMTAFGFMGYALVKPHQLGIKSDNEEDQEAFVHLWAVICSMLGVKDEFNMCLFPLDVVKSICHMFIRYAFIPFLQMETPTFAKLGRAFIEGMKWYVPFSSYESRLFLARRLAGIPGYQYDVDISKEFYQKQIFTKDELKDFQEQFQNVAGFEYRRNMVFDEKMHLLDIKRLDEFQKDEENFNEYLDYNSNTYGIYRDNMKDENENVDYMMRFLGLNHPSELIITEVDDENYLNFMNDKKFKLLSKRDQFLVKICTHHVKMLSNNITKPFYEIGLGTLLYAMKKQAF